MQVRACPSRFVETLLFPLERAPFNDIRVRRAVSMAINRDALIRNVLQNDNAVVSLLWPLDPEALTLDELPPEVRKYLQYDPQEAKRLLADAGFPQGFDTKFIYTTTYGSPWNELAEAVVSMLRDVGIRAELDILEYGAFLRATNVTGQYDVPALAYRNRFSTHDIAANLLWSKTPGPDVTHVKRAPDPQMDALIEQLWSTSDAQKHKQLSQQIQIRLAEQATLLFTPTWSNAIIAQPWVKNLGWRGNEKFFTNLLDQAWIDK
jgi:peptide/nickel transport system substrate-binding protein